MPLPSTIKRALPVPVKEAIKRAQRRLRHARNRAGARTGGVLTVADLAEQFRALGVRPGDTVVLHSSLSRVGMVEGGAAAVVAALRQAAGAQGTVMVPTHNLKVEAGEHFATDPLFDVRATPSITGAICEALRLLPDARRSLHPTHSVAAIGPRAAHLTEAHHTAVNPFGPASPYWRLAELGGTIIMLGVPLANLTNFHVVEAMLGEDFPYPVNLPEPVQARVRDADGSEIRVMTTIHNPEMSVRRRCNEMEPHFLRHGVMTVGQVGRARTLVLDAAKLNEALLSLTREHITMYTPDGAPLAVARE